MGKSQVRDGFASSVTIEAPSEVILRAFFDHEELVAWWHIKRSLCVPRTFGCYAVEWETTEYADETLGRLGGVFHGTVVTFDPQHEFFVADAYWMAPDGDPIGPMALEVTCTAAAAGTLVQFRQSGRADSARWSRYYELAGTGLTTSLQRLKTMLEPLTPPARS